MSADEILKAAADDSPNALSRRDFIKLVGGGIFVFVSIGDFETLAQEPTRIRAGQYPADFNAYLRIAPDGRVTGFTGKIEQGQGAINALPLMLADELEISPDRVEMVMGDTDLCPFDMGTFGSQCIRSFGPALRAAGAEARLVLIELAAERLKVPKERLQTKGGVISDKSNPKAMVTYGELAQGKAIERHLTVKPTLKPPAEFKVMGTPAFRRDAKDKSTGKALYAGDIRVPGMVYGRVLRPPAHGATLRSLDTSGAESVPGAKVVHDGDLIAVVHELPDVALAALAKIKAEWDPPAVSYDDKTIFDYLVKNAPEARPVAAGGDLAEGAKLAAFSFDETYFNAYVAHSAMETHTAVVEIKGDKATVWSSTQAPFRTKDEVAQALGIPAANVHAIMPFVGGGFGGKTASPQAVQAARLAKAVGKPVQVTWSRAEEFFNDTFRPASIVKIKSGVSKEGRIVFWDYDVYFAGERTAAHFYDIPNHRTVARGDWGGGGGAAPSAHPFAVGPWRAPSSNSNAHARESQIDIMAAKAERDPVEFRLAHLANPRMQKILQAAAAKFGWTPGKAPSGRGFGVALSDYAGTYVAAMAEVAVEKSSGKVQVKRMVCAHDSGVAVNPEGMRIQIEGCLTMGLGYALTEEIHFQGRRITDLNFDTYTLPKFAGLPKIETVIVDSPEVPISGGGEPAITPVGAVIANAIFDATGARLFQLPMTPERVQAALK